MLGNDDRKFEGFVVDIDVGTFDGVDVAFSWSVVAWEGAVVLKALGLCELETVGAEEETFVGALVLCFDDEGAKVLEELGLCELETVGSEEETFVGALLLYLDDEGAKVLEELGLCELETVGAEEETFVGVLVKPNGVGSLVGSAFIGLNDSS